MGVMSFKVVDAAAMVNITLFLCVYMSRREKNKGYTDWYTACVRSDVPLNINGILVWEKQDMFKK